MKYRDGYVFLRSSTSWSKVCLLWQGKVVRFAAQNYAGSDEIVAFVQQARGKGSKRRLRAKMRKVQLAANPTSSSAVATVVGLTAPSRWSLKQPFAAHVRIVADEGMAEAVFNALDPRGPHPVFRRGHGYNGHALCQGDWDVLLELGANSNPALTRLVGKLSGVAGISSMTVTRTMMRQRQPKPPTVC